MNNDVYNEKKEYNMKKLVNNNHLANNYNFHISILPSINESSPAVIISPSKTSITLSASFATFIS